MVTMIPVEDIISIHYTVDLKKSTKLKENMRQVPVVDQQGCCCCAVPKPEHQTEMTTENHVQRMITIHLQYSKHSNLDTVSNARILSGDDRQQFYKDHFQPATEKKFYLVNNIEHDSKDFEQKKLQAESLCRIITQMKGMNVGVPSTSISYPNPQEFQEILSQPHSSVFGDISQERVHSVQAQALGAVTTWTATPMEARLGNKPK
ncbi:unnamed protein product [Adineta ricciae]|uniref:Uncharacterized protein n=1 Tax=Adineta ricciae TaxID=249248 RepID=A0A815ARN9_ADIRI|nr:unnamed protein product [Adineta ricciae]CAF1260663.1 unnamed protein product [Adineta ricciae]